MHHYPFHIGDYMKATAHLTDEEDLCYRRLLDYYYDTESPIPVETQSVSRRLRVDTERLQVVLNDFFVLMDDGYHHARCDSEIAEYRVLCERNKANGKAGGRPKKTQSVSSGNPVETQLKANQEPITNNQVLKTFCHQPLAEDDLSDCPHDEILSLYAEILPELPQPRIWEGARRKNLTSRWRWALADLKKKNKPADRADGVDFFRRLFEYVGKSDFLMGRAGRWSADLGWIVKAEPFAKIIQGNYENKESS